MGIYYNQSFAEYKTAKELITGRPDLAGRDGLYMLYPGGPSDVSSRQIVYCDMTTDGGGWMMIARSHPTTVNYGGQNWGWRGGLIGSVSDYTQAYQAGWWTWWNPNGATFTEFIFGNRANINNNVWGSFIYKRSSITYTTLVNSDTQQGAGYSTLRSDLNVYGSANPPGMQTAIGYPITGTANNLYYMRDCCGYAGIGGAPTGLSTAYCGSDAVWPYAGPWCGGSATDGSGNFLSGTYVTAGGNRYGGTNQYMIMVR